jgi:integrase
MKVHRREYLGLYIFAKPINELERGFNETILQKAEAIRCLRVTSLVNEQFDFLDREKMRGDFIAYFKKLAHTKYDKWDAICRHFTNFVHGKCTFGEVTVELCQKFRDYLLHDAHSLSRPQFKLCNNSAAGYWSTFRGLLRVAYRDKMIRENINDYLDRIETEEVKKQYLTAEELKQLAKTPCKIPILKDASLFSCLTGLRLSDVLNLQWEDIELASDGEYCMRIRTQKTQTAATLPISSAALKLCGERGTGKVFKGFKRCMASYPLKQWLKEAGITKPITFHSFRHTYATLQIASGTDIYTVSKMLVHKNVTTTQIYADLVSKKKRETVDKISLE